VDARSDLFSLGSVLYCMITGRPPFRAETTFGILRRVTDDEPRPLRELQADAPAWLETLTGRLLRKPVQERFESADQLAAILEECLAHVQQPSTAPLPRSLSSTQTDTARQRSRRLVAGSILASLMAIGVGLVVGPKYFGTPRASGDQEPQPSPAMTSKTSPTAGPEEEAEAAKTTADVPVDIPADIDIEASLQQTNAEFDAMEQALDSEFAAP
jgi:serine/threonine protein kinase